MPSFQRRPDDTSPVLGDPDLTEMEWDAAEGVEEVEGVEEAEGAEPDPDLDRVRPGLLQGPAERLLLLVAMAAGATMAWTSHMEGQEILTYLGSFLVTFSGLSLLVRLPSAYLNRKRQVFLSEWVQDLGKGYYSLAALSVFLWWEVALLLEGMGALVDGSRGIVGSLVEILPGFGLESLFNVFMAMAWPLFLLGDLGLQGVALFAGGAWITLRVGSTLVSTPAWMLEGD